MLSKGVQKMSFNQVCFGTCPGSLLFHLRIQPNCTSAYRVHIPGAAYSMLDSFFSDTEPILMNGRKRQSLETSLCQLCCLPMSIFPHNGYGGEGSDTE